MANGPYLIKDKSFDDLVGRHIRSVTDERAEFPEEDVAFLRAHLSEWWVSLVQRKKASETQLAAKKAEMRSQRIHFALTDRQAEAAKMEREYNEWRAKNLRFKNAVEQVISEVAVLVEEHRGGVFREILIEERNVLAGRVRELEDALLNYCTHVHGPDCDPVCALKTQLCTLVDLVA